MSEEMNKFIQAFNLEWVLPVSYTTDVTTEGNEEDDNLSSCPLGAYILVE